ncbi:hypothetical protein [Mesotoga prima]|uniref:hypothetical protein n=1 Tax=Mesotoga prima TaxID=1184387 RepID=UPI002C8ED75F|nr:hypothetical protein [Mesotoga prima]HQC15715.1 hypothetical protein [Mesotoga prima]
MKKKSETRDFIKINRIENVFKEGPLMKKLRLQNIPLEDLLKEIPEELLRRFYTNPRTSHRLITSLFLVNEFLSAVVGETVRDLKASEEHSEFMTILNKGCPEKGNCGYFSAGVGEEVLLTSVNMIVGKPLISRAYEAVAKAVLDILRFRSELQDLSLGKMNGKELGKITGIESDLFWNTFIELYNSCRLILERQKGIDAFLEGDKKKPPATGEDLSKNFGIGSVALCRAFIENIANKRGFEDSAYEAIFEVLNTRIPISSVGGEFKETRRIINITITSFDETYLETKRQLDEKLGDVLSNKSKREHIEDNVRIYVIANIFKNSGSKTFWKDTWNFLVESEGSNRPWDIFDSIDRDRLIKAYKKGEKLFAK